MNKVELLQRAKPILFNAGMVQAILEGRKTVTRRAMKLDLGLADTDKNDSSYLKIPDKYGDYHDAKDLCRYQPGDILYVRETWTVEGVELEGDKWIAYIGYKAEGNTQLGYQTKMKIKEDEVEKYKEYLYGEAEFKPSIHMPKKAARIFLKVKDVYVERLQDITEEQARKEGFSDKFMFMVIWDEIYKNALHNPWVWVIEFERVEIRDE